ncbi:MAG: O-antigen ligase family protein [Lachnospiraceae bacterium]|nr:O-antigen ligase family protein [Lachnospiraceae bacterium]
MARLRKNDEKLNAKSTFSSVVEVLIDIAVSLYIFLLFVWQPLYYTEGYAHIGSDKGYFYMAAIRRFAPVMSVLFALYLTASMVEFIRRKTSMKDAVRGLINSLSVTDIAVLFFMAGVVISYSFSDYKEDVLWGAPGWYIGMVPLLAMGSAYFFISRFFGRHLIVFLSFMPTSFIVFVLGILNRAGVYPIEMESAGPSFISTIGNINWYCGYLTVALFAGVGLLYGMLLFYEDIGFKYKDIVIELLFAYALIGIISLFTQGSDSGKLAFFAVVLLSIYVLLRLRGFAVRLSNIYAGVIAFLFLAGVILIAYNTMTEGRLSVRLPEWTAKYLIFDDTWGSRRGRTWREGIETFLAQTPIHKLFGVGPDGMSAYMYSEVNEEIFAEVSTVWGGKRLTNAHGEWLTILVNEGIFGCISFIALIISAILRFLGNKKRDILVFACGLSVFAYTVNNSFSFETLMNMPTMFVFLALGECYLRKASQRKV